MRYIISLLLTSAAAPLWADVPRVVTDIVPVQSLVAQVMGDLGTPVLLLDRGASAHEFQLRPSQAASVADAQLLVWVGPELTPWLERAAASLAPDTPRLTLLDAPETYRRAFDKADGDHDHDHGDTHDHDGTDPHAWLDPANAQTWLGLIAAELSRLDPPNAETYSANATAASSDIAALDADIAAQLASVKERPFVVYHDAYGYFTAHYGLTLAGTVSEGDAAAPGAARLEALQNVIGQGQTLCLFPEAQHDAALVAQLAEGSTARVGGALDPAGSLIDPGRAAYATTLRAIADTLTACLLP